eukprot:scaffold78785_cov48-Phaeocystis_antarctica.AAC.1
MESGPPLGKGVRPAAPARGVVRVRVRVRVRDRVRVTRTRCRHQRALRDLDLDGLVHARRAVAIAERGDRRRGHLLRGARLVADEAALLTARALRREYHRLPHDAVRREELAQLRLAEAVRQPAHEELHLVGHRRRGAAASGSATPR